MRKNHTLYKHFSLLLCFALSTSLGLPAVHAEETKKITSPEQEMLVLYKNTQGKEKIIETGNEVDYQYKNIKAIAVKVDASDIRELKKDPNIVDVEPNVSFKITGETNEKVLNFDTFTRLSNAMPAEESQWDFLAMNGPEMLRQGITGKGVKVAVVDTGIASHFDLKIAGGISTVSYTNSFSDDNGHGTNIAGIIGALHNGKGVVGIASDVQLYAVKALDQSGRGNLIDITKGIDWAITNHMDIINLSLGTPDDSQLLHDMVDKAYKAGILIVGAAGNDSGPVNYPAKYDSVIAVSAIDSNKNLASFSSRGEEVEFSAPGVDIFNLNNTGGYVYMSGTSQASPHIAGFLADLKQMHTEMSALQLRIELSRYAKDLGTVGHDGLYGYGFIQYMSMPNSISNSQLLVQQQISFATQQTELAEQTRAEIDIQNAQSSIDLLPDGSEKESLQARLKNLIQSIQEEMILAKKIEDASDAVDLAETDCSFVNVEKAQQLTEMLPDGSTRQSLQSRIDAMRSFLENNWRQTVEAAVSTAEKTNSQSDLEAAQKDVYDLPKNLGKDLYQARLNALKKLLAEEEKINALYKAFSNKVSFTELVGMEKELAFSRTAVQALPETEKKTSLLSLLSSLETKMLLQEKVLKATMKVIAAEKSPNGASSIYSAQTAINTLPAGSDRLNLQKRLNTVKAKIALEAKIAAATKAVAAAEKYKSNSTIALAAAKIRTLPAGKTRTALQNRLNHAIHLKKRSTGSTGVRPPFR